MEIFGSNYPEFLYFTLKTFIGAESIAKCYAFPIPEVLCMAAPQIVWLDLRRDEGFHRLCANSAEYKYNCLFN